MNKKVKAEDIAPIILTEEQKNYIDENWKNCQLIDMVRKVFNNESLEGRTREGRAVREYMQSKNYQYAITTPKSRADFHVEFTSEMDEFIINNVAHMKPHEIAQILFNNNKLIHTTKEAIAVTERIKQIAPTLIDESDDFTEKEYLPPKTLKGALLKVNAARLENVTEDKLTNKEIKCLEKLLEYLNSPRYISVISAIKNKKERRLFEHEFVLATWNKPDLSFEEIGLYIDLVNERILQIRIQETSAKLDMMLKNIVNDGDGKTSMALAETIGKKNDEYDRSIKRAKDLSESLTGKRSERQKNKHENNRSLVALVEQFQDKQNRKEMLKIAEIRKKAVSDEIKRLTAIDEWKARVFGISEEEILD